MSRLFAPKRTTAAKVAPYECGIVPTKEPPERFPVSFYLVAMLFVMFDIEIVFMYPWAVVYRPFVAEFGPVIFWSMLSFILILLFGYVYAVKKGALEWDERPSARS